MVIWFITITSLLLGYWLGKRGENITEDIQTMSKLVTNKLNKTKLGAVPTPTQDQIERWRNPKQYEEEQTMKDTFENLGVKNA